MDRRSARSLRALCDRLLPGGHGLPGAAELGVAAAFQERMASWSPATRASVAWLLRAWEWGPVLSRHLRPFSALGPARQAAWIESCRRARFGLRRQLLQLVKQLVFLTWAAQPEAEAALGYDGSCYGDDPAECGPAPVDYLRPGPALSSGALVLARAAARSGEARSADLACLSFPELGDGQVLRCDVLVIGSGAGGAVTAAHLAEAGCDVIVAEEGPHVTRADFSGAPFDRFQRFCRDEGTTTVLGRPPIPLPLGRVVGGTTVVNAGTCFRAPAAVLARWERAHGIAGAHPEALAPYYEAAEEALNVRPVPWELLGNNGRLAYEGARRLGLSGGPLLRNIAACHGCGQCVLGCPTDAKQAMHITYLPRAQRAGARILARCRVDAITIERGRATGARATLLDGSDRPAGGVRIAAGAVVVAAGAVHTPLLLARSGVEDPSGQTGRNLRIHPATGVLGVFDEVIDNWRGTLQSYYVDELLDDHGIMFEATSTIPGIGAGSVAGVGAEAMEQLAAFRRTAMLGFYVSDTSAGRVRAGPGGRPLLTYRLNRSDTERVRLGLVTATRILLAAGARRVHVGLPGLQVAGSEADLAGVQRHRLRPWHLRLTAFHPMGTVRMGSDPERSVLDPFGRHRGAERLWVADASIFPTCVGVNPQLTIMAFAHRTAEAIAAS